jgi:hypothetical protein
MSRSVNFTARDFGAFEQNGVLVAGFARDRSDESSDEALILQRALEDADAVGVDVEIPIQRFFARDGVKEAKLYRDKLSVTFYPEAAVELNGIGRMNIAFSMSGSEYANIEAALRRIFREDESFSILQADVNQSKEPAP